ncbi:hypothetical protein Plhal304r1_c001g0002911 [Plasmopara halstedii]
MLLSARVNISSHGVKVDLGALAGIKEANDCTTDELQRYDCQSYPTIAKSTRDDSQSFFSLQYDFIYERGTATTISHEMTYKSGYRRGITAKDLTLMLC